MSDALVIISQVVLIPLAVLIAYYDVRYRRIPNLIVLGTLVVGLAVNGIHGGWSSLGASMAGCALAFALMFILHLFGAMGAGDVKLFAAIGALIGMKMVLPTFLIILLTGGLLALVSMVYSRTVRTTMFGVARIFYGLLPGTQGVRGELIAAGRQTIPYGVAITLGSLISVIWMGARA